MLLQLTPVQSLLGGVSLGLLCAGRLLLHGKIFGVSGNIKGLVKGGFDSSRAAVVGGLVAGGVLLKVFAPGCFGVIPVTFSLPRALIAGILVGSGASLANGCTSGHGICGNARLSPRSVVFTLLIMATGALSVRLTGTAEALGVADAHPKFLTPTRRKILTGLGLVGVTAATLRGFSQLLKPKQTGAAGKQSPVLEIVADGLEGTLFSLALGYAGMTNPGKVAAFLNLTPAGFDYSLAFVMGGAVLTSLAPFLSVFRGGGRKQAAVTGQPFPSLSGTVDARLVVGGVLFGAGWGLGGLCPGPGLAGLATLQAPVLLFNAAMLSAMYAAR